MLAFRVPFVVGTGSSAYDWSSSSSCEDGGPAAGKSSVPGRAVSTLLASSLAPDCGLFDITVVETTAGIFGTVDSKSPLATALGSAADVSPCACRFDSSDFPLTIGCEDVVRLIKHE